MEYYHSKFSHIYIEKRIKDHFRTQEILSHFPNAKMIYIDHYKDLFNRKHQDYELQHNSQALILAMKDGSNVYEGARVCQSFDNEFFYYTSNVMNCLFDCEYCYLKGMYPSGNMVIFVNLEDTFAEVEELLKEHKVYLCISYDTDLLAIEKFTGFVALWADFVMKHPDLKIEIRTKAATRQIYDVIAPCDRIIFAYTLSPEAVSKAYEHGAATLTSRMEAAAYGLCHGFPVRLCFDPMIYCPDWKQQYNEMLREVRDILGKNHLNLCDLNDISVGSFRISQDYMKKMRKAMPASAVVQYPYENIGGVYQYPDKLRDEMEQFLVDDLTMDVPADKIFTWEES